MRKLLYCASLFFLSVLSAQADSTWKETRSVLFTSSAKVPTRVLNPGQSISEKLYFTIDSIPTRRFLRIRGGVKMPAPYQNRGETTFRSFEYQIDDNLDSVCRKNDRYALYYKGDNDNFERLAFNRIPGELLKPGELTITLPVVRKNALAVGKDGYFGLQVGLYYQKEGRAASDIYDVPDSLWNLPIPTGTGRMQQVTKTFQLPQGVACVFLQLGGTNFSGECWVEAPRFRQHGKEVCRIPFTKYAERTDTLNYWAGCNLSSRSWPKWKLDYDGKTLFEGTRFDRASYVADFYIPLPANLRGGGEMTLQLVDEPHRANFPYEIHGIELIEQTARDFELISVPRYVTKDSAFGLLVETNEPNVTVKVTTDGPVSPVAQECYFSQPGLHVIEMRAGEAGQSIQLTLENNGHKETASVLQVIDKEFDKIYVSSGDEIYIDKAYLPYDYFFKWYFANRVGNWYHFRPSYQWSGFRVADSTVIRHYTKLLDRLQVPYAWQVEGRTLASTKINPSLEVLESPMFRGKQAHENDGGYYYWGHFKYEGLFSDLAARARPLGGIFAKHRPIVTDHGTFVHYDPAGVDDMAEGARNYVANLRYSKGESSRHTGPSTTFRYFYQAGYDWLGAEQMYGPEETILSSLRGASRAYSRPEYGTLHAMQWSSGPFSDPKHSLRLYMSLAVAYMHGSSHMNTEEALWTDEYTNDRYTEGGKQHLFAQHQVLDFVETHTRRGELKSNIAVIQGRNDAWKSFLRGNLWSQKGNQWKFDKANESFDLLHVFYPENIIDCCGPNGWFTSTPFGTVDLLPIEAPREVMNRYKALIFLGWNTYDSADFERIRDFVFQGGTLLLSAAHLNEELQPNTPTRLPHNDGVLRQLLGENYRQLNDKTVGSYGAGKVVYFPQAVYPAEDSLKEAYVSARSEIAYQTVSEELSDGWILASESVGFTVWNRMDRRTIYLLNTDWKSDREEHPATFVYKGKTFTVPVRRYHIETIHCAAGLAVCPSSNTTDVLSVEGVSDGWKVKVQTATADQIRIMNGITGTCTSQSIDKAGIHEFIITKS